MRKRSLVLLAAVIIAGASVCLIGKAVVAQEATPTAPARPISQIVEQLWNKVAGKLGVERAELDKAITEARQEVVAEAAKSGQLTEQQADRLLRRWPFGGGRGGLQGPRCRGDWLAAAVREQELLAKVLGMTTDELAAELKAGKTPTEIAQARGMDADALHKALAKERVRQAVEAGEMTQEQADWLLQGIENGYTPRGPGFAHGMRGGRHGFGGPWGPGGELPGLESPSVTPEQQVNPGSEPGSQNA